MSATYAIKIADDVMDVLNRSTMTDTQVILPPGNLDRKLYESVDKVLKTAGGKWNRSAKAHVFPKDPRQLLGLALGAGSIVDEKKAKQQFFSPVDVAAQVVRLANIQPGMRVLEPSAGAGALAMEAERHGGDVDCVELDPDLASDLLKHGGLTVICGDFLNLGWQDKHYDRVVMNPPFAKGQDIKHVTHALQFLKPGGRLVSVMPAGIVQASTKAAKAFRAMLDERTSWRVVPLPADSFKESGTGVMTVMLIVEDFS